MIRRTPAKAASTARPPALRPRHSIDPDIAARIAASVVVGFYCLPPSSIVIHEITHATAAKIGGVKSSKIWLRRPWFTPLLFLNGALGGFIRVKKFPRSLKRYGAVAFYNAKNKCQSIFSTMAPNFCEATFGFIVWNYLGAKMPHRLEFTSLLQVWDMGILGLALGLTTIRITVSNLIPLRHTPTDIAGLVEDLRLDKTFGWYGARIVAMGMLFAPTWFLAKGISYLAAALHL